MSQKQLHRSLTDRKIGGVAGGIAEYFNIDPTLVRLIWAITIFWAGTGVLAYIIAWFIIPEATISTDERASKNADGPIIDVENQNNDQQKD